jgi:hypothetical protein
VPLMRFHFDSLLATEVSAFISTGIPELPALLELESSKPSTVDTIGDH